MKGPAGDPPKGALRDDSLNPERPAQVEREATHLTLLREAAARLPKRTGPSPVPTRDRRDSRGPMLRRLLLIADVAALASAFAAAEIYGLVTGSGDRFILKELALLAAGLPVWLLLAHAHRLYHLDSRRAEYGAAEELGPIIQMTTLWVWGVTIVVSFTGIATIPVGQFAIFWATAILALLAFRGAVRIRSRRQIWYLQNTLVIGTTAQVGAMVAKINRHPEYGVHIVACVDFSGNESVRLLGSVPILGASVDLLEVIEDLDVERVILAWSADHGEERFDLVRELSELNVQVDLIPSWFEVLGVRLDIHEMEGTPLLTVPRTKLTRSALLLKRALDIAVSGTALVLLSPLLAVCAVCIKLDSPGPIFFRQRRVGKDDRRFELLKFRSMHEDAELRKPEIQSLNIHGGRNGEGLFKARRDPRVTRVGRWLRRASIDELPQLLNILRGDMSLVGPRPLVENEDRQVEGRFRRRLSLTPGLTGLWQVSGRSEIPFDQMVNLDYLYVSSWSLWGDLKILIRTASAVLARRGAY